MTTTARRAFGCSGLCRLTVLAGLALAAPAVTAPAMADDFGWSGYHVGLHGGGGWGNASGIGGTGEALTEQSLDLSGGLIGFHLGYDHQFDRLVVGIEGDYSFAHLRGTSQTTVEGVEIGLDNELEHLASIRARLGLPIDDLLVYASVGGAWSRYRLAVETPAGIVSEGADISGVVFGGGVEWLLERGLLVRGELLHYDFRKAQLAADDVDGEAEVDADATVLRSAVSFWLN